jgi:cell division protein FtsB
MLTAQRGELQDQLQQLAERRNQLFAQSRTMAEGPARHELEMRMNEIDTRSSRLDGQIQALNDRIVDAMGRVGQSRSVIVEPRVVPQISIPPFEGPGSPGFRFRGPGPDMREVGGIMAAEAVALVLIGVIAWRFGMKRMREQFDRVFTQQASQMNQLQQAVDVIGIEVERISEGQRYVAKMLNEGVPASMTGGRKDLAPAPPVRSREG